MAKRRAILIGAAAVAVIAAIAGYAAWKNAPAALPAPVDVTTSPCERPTLPVEQRMVVPDAPLDPAALKKKVQAFEDLKARAEKGERVAQRNLAEAYEACFLAKPTAENSGYDYASRLRAIAPPDMAEVAMQVAAKRIADCQAVDGGVVRWALIGKWYEEAAKNGDIAAQMAVIHRKQQTLDRAASTGVVQRVIASNDPAVAFAMGEFILGVKPQTGDAKYDELLYGPISSIAWEITGCRMGHDCGPSGAVMEQACLESGRCTGETYEDYARSYLMSPQDMGELDQQIEGISRLFKERCIPPHSFRDGVCSLRVE